MEGVKYAYLSGTDHGYGQGLERMGVQAQIVSNGLLWINYGTEDVRAVV